MADLQGPKIRVGKFEDGKMMLDARRASSCSTPPARAGRRATASASTTRSCRATCGRATCCCSTTGCIVLDVDDGATAREVHTVGAPSAASCRTTRASTGQGGGLTAPALTAKDMDDIRTADELPVRLPRGVASRRAAPTCRWRASSQRAGRAGHKPQLIAKIERTEAIPALEDDPERLRRHHGGARRPRGRGRQRGGAGAAEAHDPHGARAEQAHHHRDADDGVDDRQARCRRAPR